MSQVKEIWIKVFVKIIDNVSDLEKAIADLSNFFTIQAREYLQRCKENNVTLKGC